MRHGTIAWGAAVFLLFEAGTLQAQTETTTAASGANEAAQKTPATEDDAEDDFGHDMQFGLRAGVVGGYRMVFRYDESPFCAERQPGKEEQKFCGFGSPLGVDVALSFAPLAGLEPFLWGRFGFSGEEETNTQPLVLIGAGTRLYTMSGSRFKIYVEPALGWELEGGAGGNPRYANAEYKKDLIFHLAAGPQIDVAKAVGFYLDAGINVGVLRALSASLDLRAGVQVRVP